MSARNCKGELVNELSTERNCIGCGMLTSWEDSICSKCERGIPKYIPKEQIDYYIVTRRKKREIGG